MLGNMPDSQVIQRDLLEETRAALSSCLGLDSLDINDSSALGVTRNWDSLKHMEVVLIMEEKFGITPSAQNVVEMMSFSGLCRAVLSQHPSFRPQISLTQSDFVMALRRLGLGTGDHVFVQSSIGTFGKIENPLDTIKNAFLEVIGRDGTLAVPAFNFGFFHGKEFDVDKTPSESGIFSEYIRTRSNALRSQHPPFHSVAAIGKYSAELHNTRANSSFSRDSVFGRMVDLDFKVCMFGTTLIHNTFFHYVEEQVGVPYRFYKPFSSLVRQNNKSEIRNYKYYARYSHPVIRSDFQRIGEALKDRFDCKTTFVGMGPIFLFRARRFFEVCSSLLARSPELFVDEDDKPKLKEIGRGEYRK